MSASRAGLKPSEVKKRFSFWDLNAIRFSIAQFLCDKVLTTTAFALMGTLLILSATSTYFTHIGHGETNWTAVAYNYSYPGRVGFAVTAIVGAQLATRSLVRGTLSRVFVDNRSRKATFGSFLIAGLIHVTAISIIFSVLHWMATNLTLYLSGVLATLPSTELTLSAVRAVFVMISWGMIGMALGLIIRSPFITVSFILGLILIVEPTLTAVANQSGENLRILSYLPGSLNWAITWPKVAPYASQSNDPGLPYSVASMLLLIDTVAILVVSWFRTPVHEFYRRA